MGDTVGEGHGNGLDGHDILPILNIDALDSIQASQSPSQSQEKPFQHLTLTDAVMINVGTMIGSGIFFVPATIALYIHDPIWMLGIWVFAGIISLLGALSIAELGAALPKAGGQYVYLSKAYGPVFGYLYGWTTFSVINTASIAAVAIAFTQYLGYFIPLSPELVKLIALGVIGSLTFINCLGVKSGAWVQNIFTLTKVMAMVGLIGLSFILSGGHWGNFHPVSSVELAAGLPHISFWGAIGLAVIGVLWAYDGWIQITYVAGEVQDPQKNLPKAIIFSTFLVIGVYALINMAYVYVLGIPAIASHPLVASETAQHLMGPMGASWVTALVMVSTFGACNGFILTGARIYYAMAKEGQFFKAVGKLHPKNQAPQASLILQGLWSMALVLSGSFEQLFTYVVFASWLFYALSCSAVLKLRKTDPELARPYKCWGYPVTPVLFILFATWLMINTIMEAPQNALMGCGIILMGLPGYFYWKRTSPKPEEVTHVP